MLDGLLAQRVGIVYKDVRWADRMFDKVVKTYPAEWVVRIVKNKSTRSIFLKDGTEIDFIYAGNSYYGSCGCRFDKIGMQEDVDPILIKEVIRPCLRMMAEIKILKEEGL